MIQPQCHNPLAKIEAQERPYWFTCTFPGEDERIAVMRVYGAESQEQARAAVHTCWQKCQYTVASGDESHGYARPFMLILNRNASLLRFVQEQSKEVQGCCKQS